MTNGKFDWVSFFPLLQVFYLSIIFINHVNYWKKKKSYIIIVNIRGNMKINKQQQQQK